MKYYLVDAERSIATKSLHYWKANKHGYTTDLSEAGLFSEEEANKLVKGDYNNRTIKYTEYFAKSIHEEK